MTQEIAIDELQKIPDRIPVADTRTPAEFTRGHIPGAFNLPLFSNEERVRVGTTYKQQGREAAILLGFDLTGAKWSGFIRTALELAPEKRIAVHCWRGGMRSAAMAWALGLYGFDVYQVKGGYKSYRQWVFRQLKKPYSLLVIGGNTGSGKTKLLHELSTKGGQVVDLEDLAQHQGSSYGSLNRLVQPSQEQFENDLATRLSRLDPNRNIWIEDESRNVGRCLLPQPLWQQMQEAILFDLHVPLDQRVDALVNEYGALDKEFLVECTDRIRKRLGLEQAKQAVQAIREGRMADFIRIALVYYDKTYRKLLDSRSATRIFPIDLTTTEADLNAGLLIKTAQSIVERIDTTNA